ncbi:MAG: Hpt domain-containing protein [Candidatus Competibacter sp.]|nr:Hpt domain-containing protein [Candidatus Competibacter sp.]MDG4583698.1 Hpt domain-containing protein [Candidatus Competibacter sp.]
MSDTDLDRLPVLDNEVIAELREIMEDEFAELLHTFLGDLPLQLDRLRIAVTQSDADAIKTIAHTIKPTCAYLGALRLAEMFRRMEQAGREKTLDGVADLLERTRAMASTTIAGLQSQLDRTP